MERKEEIIIEKFRKAEEIRKIKGTLKQKTIEERYRERIRDLVVYNKVSELESGIKSAWKFREHRQIINKNKKELDGKVLSELLKIKVQQQIIRQDRKFRRKILPKHPKVDPLPYLKHFDHDEYSSEISESQESIEEETRNPKLRYRIVSNTPDTKKKQNHKRNASTMLRKIPFNQIM